MSESNAEEPIYEDCIVLDMMEMTNDGSVYLIRRDGGRGYQPKPDRRTRFYYQQVAGGLCSHRIAEGWAQRLDIPAWQLPHVGCCGALDASEADEMDAALADLGLPFRVDRARVSESTEAWVHVRLTVSGDKWPAILTYENCD